MRYSKDEFAIVGSEFGDVEKMGSYYKLYVGGSYVGKAKTIKEIKLIAKSKGLDVLRMYDDVGDFRGIMYV